MKDFEQRFLAEVIDKLAHPVFVKDREFRYVIVNAALIGMIGFEGETVIGKTDHELFSPSEAAAFRVADEQAFLTERQVQIDEETLVDKSGKKHYLATTKVPLRNDAGEITHVVGIVHDITELKTTQEALRQVNEGLEQRVEERTRALQAAQEDLVRKARLAELGKLAGGVAHEIRNPLSAIKNAAYILERQLGKDRSPEIDAALAIMHDEVARANHIVGELLDYARVREPERRRVLLADLISAALKACDVPSGVEVTADAGADMVIVDATQVEAALSNLIRNSIEAMHGIGKISFELAPNGELSKVRVRDTGPGIAPEIESRLFEPLVTTTASGLGLGLVTARTLVERQGGTLVYEADARPGACFEISLPRAA